jgi:hypothetical protein
MHTIEFSFTETQELAAYLSALIDNQINFSLRRDNIAVAVTIKGKTLSCPFRP